MEALEIKLFGGSGGVYVKEKILGRGSSATVFLVKAKETLTHDDEYENENFLPPLMAVKSVPFCDAESLIQEQEIFSKLQGCPQILQFYGEGLMIEKGTEVYSLWMEFAPEGSLSDLIKKHRSSSRRRRNGSCNGLPEIEVRRYTQSILLGLKHIHECGFVHCDLKPENILICENNVAKIADFGLSMKTYQMKNKFRARGTPLYMAPEAISSESYQSISDVWGLGCIVLEMLSGKQPWDFAPNTKVNDALNFIAGSKELPIVPRKLSPLALDFLRKCLVRDSWLRWSPDMLLKHPFVEEAFTEASRISSSESSDLPRPNLPSSRSKISQELSIKVVPLVGLKRKWVMDDEAEELEESIGSKSSTKENESHDSNLFQRRYWGLRRCSMAGTNSVDADTIGF